jgi:hypothetical protein
MVARYNRTLSCTSCHGQYCRIRCADALLVG